MAKEDDRYPWDVATERLMYGNIDLKIGMSGNILF
jgi:hypothetical protein